jgi:predicted ATPase
LYIKRIDLKKFKSYANSSITLRGGLTLLVGGNNSGKSSFLQALATWQFCKNLLEIEKGRESWTVTAKTQGLGLSLVDFTPMFIPSLSHLWTNLKSQKQTEKDGYTLKINVFWDAANGQEKFLEIGLSLANDRLFIKTTSTNLSLNEIVDVDTGFSINNSVPEIAYLPPFAGITDRETKLTPAMRNRLIGQGLSGGVIRNSLYDLFVENLRKRATLKGDKSKISSKDLAHLREVDPWEILQKTMMDMFSIKLEVTPFNERYHSYLRISCVKGDVQGYKFSKYKNYNSKDIMVEGSGFLQWLSVYTLALSNEFNVILLDEPDAHLHTHLQNCLTERLELISNVMNKQVILATHSSELIRAYPAEKILSLENSRGKYLAEDKDKISILSGIGTKYTPKIHKLEKNHRLLIVEGVSDERFLKKIFEKLEIQWPENIVVWSWTGKVQERYHLYEQLKAEIPDLKAVSIRDRDDESDNTVDSNLNDKSVNYKDPGFIALKWRRRHIENYFFDPNAIAAASGKTVHEIETYFATYHALVLPANLKSTDVVMAIRDARGKEIMTKGEGVKKHFSITRDDIIKYLDKESMCDDLVKFAIRLSDFSK